MCDVSFILCVQDYGYLYSCDACSLCLIPPIEGVNEGGQLVSVCLLREENHTRSDTGHTTHISLAKKNIQPQTQPYTSSWTLFPSACFKRRRRKKSSWGVEPGMISLAGNS